MRVALGIGLALASAAAINWGFFRQHQASNSLARLSLRHPVASLWVLFTNGRWLFGYAVGIGGWGLYIAALYLAPISIVQAVSAGGLGLLAIFIWRVARVRFCKREQRAIAASLIGLALILASFIAGVPHPRLPGSKTVIIWVAATLAAAILAWQPGSRLLGPGAGLGASAGLLFAAGDLATKGAVSGSGLLFVPVLLLCELLGFVCLQLAFQQGGALSTAGLSTLLNNALPILGGIVVFHERLPGGLAGGARGLGIVLVVVSAALLARPEPTPTVTPHRPC
ncbi:MAG: hypothetical protein ACYCSF_08625 [Acidimicrobiales bacterium]